MAPLSGWLVSGKFSRLFRHEEWGPAAAALAAICYAWVLAGVQPFTWPARLLTLVACGAVAMVAFRGSPRWARRRYRRGWTSAWRGPLRLGLILWLVWLAVAGAWELASLFQQPRGMHPTASSIIDQLMDSREGKAAGVTLWLMLGWELVRR